MDADLAVIINIAVACKNISNLRRDRAVRGLVGLAESKNKSGDEQKKLDVISNDIFVAAMADTARSAVIVTEEEDVPVGVDARSGDYIVCFDPIDGSSNIDAAVPTGSIWGVCSPASRRGPDDDAEAALEKCVLNTRKSGEELVARVRHVLLRHGHDAHRRRRRVRLHPRLEHGRVRALPRGRQDPGDDGARGAILLGEPGQRRQVGAGDARVRGAPAGRRGDGGGPFTYRYIGALVGDFHRTLLYGGIWLYPRTPPRRRARRGSCTRLRRWGTWRNRWGAATWGPLANERVVEVVPQHIHQRSPMFVGSKSMVEGLAEFLAKEHAK